MGDCKPDGYTRYYTDRSTDVASQTWLLVPPRDTDSDCCTIMTWRDAEAMQAALVKFSSETVAEALAVDEAEFLDRTRTYFIIVDGGHGRMPAL